VTAATRRLSSPRGAATRTSSTSTNRQADGTCGAAPRR
jgi:hypothetical protein